MVPGCSLMIGWGGGEKLVKSLIPLFLRSTKLRMLPPQVGCRSVFCGMRMTCVGQIDCGEIPNPMGFITTSNPASWGEKGGEFAWWVRVMAALIGTLKRRKAQLVFRNLLLIFLLTPWWKTIPHLSDRCPIIPRSGKQIFKLYEYR